MSKHATPPPGACLGASVFGGGRAPINHRSFFTSFTTFMESGNPRINSALMGQYVGRHVRLTCKIIKAQGENIMVQAPDGGQGRVATDNYVEILGKVVDSSRMTASEVFPHGDNIDLDVVNSLVELMHKHPEIYMQ